MPLTQEIRPYLRDYSWTMMVNNPLNKALFLGGEWHFFGGWGGPLNSHDQKWLATKTLQGVPRADRCKMELWDPYKWPKINGFHWGYFTPRSGVISPYPGSPTAIFYRLVYESPFFL